MYLRPSELAVASIIGLLMLFGFYARVMDSYTHRVCGVNGYSHAVWSVRTGGVCTRVENGNTVAGHVTNL